PCFIACSDRSSRPPYASSAPAARRVKASAGVAHRVCAPPARRAAAPRPPGNGPRTRASSARARVARTRMRIRTSPRTPTRRAAAAGVLLRGPPSAIPRARCSPCPALPPGVRSRGRTCGSPGPGSRAPAARAPAPTNPPGRVRGRATAGAAATHVRTPCPPPVSALGLARPGLAAAGRLPSRAARAGARGSALLPRTSACAAARARRAFGLRLRGLFLRRRTHARRSGRRALGRPGLRLAGRRAHLQLAPYTAHAIHVPRVVHRVAHLVVAGQRAAQRDDAVLDQHLDPVRVHPRVVEQRVLDVLADLLVRAAPPLQPVVVWPVPVPCRTVRL